VWAAGGRSRAVAGARPSGLMPGTIASARAGPARRTRRPLGQPRGPPATILLGAGRARARGRATPDGRAGDPARGADVSGWLPCAIGPPALGAAGRSPAQGRGTAGGRHGRRWQAHSVDSEQAPRSSASAPAIRAGLPSPWTGASGRWPLRAASALRRATGLQMRIALVHRGRLGARTPGGCVTLLIRLGASSRLSRPCTSPSSPTRRRPSTFHPAHRRLAWPLLTTHTRKHTHYTRHATAVPYHTHPFAPPLIIAPPSSSSTSAGAFLFQGPCPPTCHHYATGRRPQP
jgi:hypothetical protein